MKTLLEVTRIDEYEIEIDEQVWDKQALKDWGDVFWKMNDLEDLAKAVAIAVMRYGLGKYMEGFGRVKQVRKNGLEITQYEKDDNGEYQVIKDFTKGLLVIVHNEDEDYSASVSD